MKSGVFHVLLIVMVLFSCNKMSNPPIHKTITYNNIEKHISELASDKYMGRAPMSDAEPLVLEYISGQMKEIGLEGANNGSYFQDVSILGITSKLSAFLAFKS
jgi:hypothetical protein